MTDFDALPGVYNALFLYIEPGNLSTYQPLLFPLISNNLTVSTILPAFLIWLTPGAAWFHHELIPAPHEPAAIIDPRTRMAIWQLGNCTSGVKRFLSPC